MGFPQIPPDSSCKFASYYAGCAACLCRSGLASNILHPPRITEVAWTTAAQNRVADCHIRIDRKQFHKISQLYRITPYGTNWRNNKNKNAMTRLDLLTNRVD